MKNDEISLKALHERLIAVEAYVGALIAHSCAKSTDPAAEMTSIESRAIRLMPHEKFVYTVDIERALEPVMNFAKASLRNPPLPPDAVLTLSPETE